MNWIIVGLVIGAGWFFLKEKTPPAQAPTPPPAPPKCPTQEQVVALLKKKGVPSWITASTPTASWPPPTNPAWTSASRAFNTTDCSLYFWNGTAWYKDTVLSAELAKTPATLGGHISFTP